MLFIFSTPVLFRHLWQLEAAVFLHRCLICIVLLPFPSILLLQFLLLEAEVSTAKIVYITGRRIDGSSFTHVRIANFVQTVSKWFTRENALRSLHTGKLDRFIAMEEMLGLAKRNSLLKIGAKITRVMIITTWVGAHS